MWQGWDVDLPRSSVGWGYYKAQSVKGGGGWIWKLWDSREGFIGSEEALKHKLAWTWLWKSGLYNQNGWKVIWNNSASTEKRKHFGNRNSKKTQFETMCLLFHDKGLLPPPAQFSPLPSASCLQSGEVNTMIMILNGSTCAVAPSDLKVWSWGSQESPSPAWSNTHPASLQIFQCCSLGGTLCPARVHSASSTCSTGSSQVPHLFLKLPCQAGKALRLYDPSQRSHNSTRAGAVCWQPKHSPYVHNWNHKWRHHETPPCPQNPSLWPQEDYKGWRNYYTFQYYLQILYNCA